MARLTSVQGTVEIRPNETLPWRRAELNDILCIGATIRVATLSRAALAFTDDSTLRLDQDTTLTIRERENERRTWLEMLTGAIHFFSHRPRSLKVDTPFVNAAAEGTEFLIRINGAEAHILMYEGVVLASNEAGQLRLGPDDAALIRAGERPIPEIVVRPRDAVAWAVHYPPVLSILADAGAPADGGMPGAYPAEVKNALEWISDNNYRYALRSLDKIPEGERTSRNEALRAGIHLNVGRVDEAEAAIERALAIDAEAADAYAVRTILHVVRNDRAQALRDADRAVQLAPNSSTALIAQSYARQASFDLEGARESLYKAVETNPSDALAYARLSEIELSFGDIDRASDAAAKATRLAPNLARTQTVQGFSHLAEIDTGAARTAFTRAIELESTDPLPHLGQGLAKIRDGNLEAGRRHLEIAAGLDPNNALIRSYLGKAYFEEKRGPMDATQFEIAKKLDPNDPTPWLYDAIRKQSENRPIEALRDLQNSIKLNDNRTTYRSSLLLDEDLAVRSSRLGRIYTDLGFEQLALIEGWKSIATNPRNYSGHRLLADTYRALPRHEIARDSELLVSQLLQPINLNAVQPRLANDGLSLLDNAGPTNTTYAEYSPLFVSNGIQVQADSLIGDQDTRAINAIGSAVVGKLSASLGYFDFETDGFRENNDLSQEIYNGFWQWRLHAKTNMQVELRKARQKEGDRAVNFFSDNFLRTLRTDTDQSSARLGLTHRFSPSSVLIGSLIRDKGDQELISGGATANLDVDGYFAELRHLYSLGKISFTYGIGYRNANDKTEFVVDPFPPFGSDSKITHRNAYIYSYMNSISNLSLIFGLSGDSFDDSLILDKDEQVNPKFGMIWELSDDTILRAAAFRVFGRTLSLSQTIEPTNIAGFNQFFDDIPASSSDRYGIGLDKIFDINRSLAGPDFFTGFELSMRRLNVRTIDPVTSSISGSNIDERTARAYVYWTPNDFLGVSAEYRFDDIDPSQNALNAGFLAEYRIHRIPLEVRSFANNGLFSFVRTTIFDQSGKFSTGQGDRAKDSDQALIVDAGLGYRFPNRIGSAAIEVRNLFDTDFQFQDVEPRNPDFSNERLFLVRLNVAF